MLAYEFSPRLFVYLYIVYFMRIVRNTVEISSSIGKVTVECFEPNHPVAVITLAHGAGAGMDHVFMVDLAKALAELNIIVVRFNFPFTEAGKKRPDFPAVAEKTIEKVIEYTRATFPNQPLFATGKSFGGRMTSQLLSKNKITYVNGLIFFGFPLHPAGKPSVVRAEHLPEVKLPMLFLQGTRDALAELSLLEPVLHKLPKATLVKFEGADHAFKVARKNIIPDLAKESINWMLETSNQKDKI